VKRALILGAGYTGKRLGRLLSEDNWRTVGTRTEERPEERESYWTEIEQFDLESQTVTSLIESIGWETGEPFSLVFTAGPPRRESIGESFELFEKFLDDLPVERLSNLVYLSSTSVYGDAEGGWVDESSDLQPISRSGRLKVRCEQLLRDKLTQSVPPVILRPGGIYGPGRNSGERYLSDDYELVGNGDKWTNRIHVDDLARICKLGCEIDEPETLNAVDGNPVRLREMVEFLYEENGQDPNNINYITWEEAEENYSEMKLGLLKPSKRVSAKKLNEKYNYDFLYPTVYDGLRSLLPDS